MPSGLSARVLSLSPDKIIQLNQWLENHGWLLSPSGDKFVLPLPPGFHKTPTKPFQSIDFIEIKIPGTVIAIRCLSASAFESTHHKEVNMKPIQYRFISLSLAGSIAAFTATSAMAAPVMPSFKQADSNGDAMISLEEFVTQGGHVQAFREGDANADGQLGSDEYIKASANNDRIKASKFVDDAWITAKVKALLLKQDGMKGLEVNVETHKGIVQLAGWVGSAEQVARAEKIALGVEGVKAVRNDLQIKI
jgi:hyperosmotically inducible protein